jgi:hypothetical protein
VVEVWTEADNQGAESVGGKLFLLVILEGWRSSAYVTWKIEGKVFSFGLRMQLPTALLSLRKCVSASKPNAGTPHVVASW